MHRILASLLKSCFNLSQLRWDFYRCRQHSGFYS